MKIEHIAMYVNDLEAVKEFFVKYENKFSDNQKIFWLYKKFFI